MIFAFLLDAFDLFVKRFYPIFTQATNPLAAQPRK